MRRRYVKHVPRDQGPRRNREIRARQILLIDADGSKLGIVSSDDGRERARQLGLDLVEVAAEARPPVCRVMDYGKWRYEQSKREASNKTSSPEVKTIRLRPATDDHDLETKLNKATRFLKRGDKVRIVMRLRGRENAYPGRWLQKLREVIQNADIPGRIVNAPHVEGRMVATMLEPA